MVKLTAFPKRVECETQRWDELFAAVSSTKHPLCDVILRVPASEDGEWVSVGCNRALLRMKSSVLDAMWQSDSSGMGVETLDIADCSEDAIRAFNAVAFGQFDAVDICVENVGDLLYAAIKYDFKLVVDCCQDFITEAIDKEDISQWLPVLNSVYSGQLTDYASKIAEKCQLSKHKTDAFTSEFAPSLCKKLFVDLLKDDELALAEDIIWLQCVEWAKHNSGEAEMEEETEDEEKEDVKTEDSDSKVGGTVVVAVTDHSTAVVDALREFRQFIRFPLLSLDFLYEHVVPSGLLSDSEVVTVGLLAAGKCGDRSIFCSKEQRIGHHTFDRNVVLTPDSTEGVSISESGKTVRKCDTKGHHLVVCNEEWSSGVHCMEVTVGGSPLHEAGGGEWTASVGVVKVGALCRYNTYVGSSIASWGLMTTIDRGGAVRGGAVREVVLPRFTTGDVICCQVDFKAHTVKYSINGDRFFTVFRDVVGPVNPAISLRTTDSSMTIR